jgi:hypothetical protein
VRSRATLPVGHTDGVVDHEGGSGRRLGEAEESRSLADVLRNWIREGRSVRLAVGDTVWTARPGGVSEELVQVGPTSVVLGRVTSVRAGLAGVQAAEPAVEAPPTLVGLLEEVASRPETVEIGGPDLEPIQGRVLGVVAGSHVEVAADDGSEWLVPLASLGWLSRGDSGAR